MRCKVQFHFLAHIHLSYSRTIHVPFHSPGRRYRASEIAGIRSSIRNQRPAFVDVADALEIEARRDGRSGVGRKRWRLVHAAEDAKKRSFQRRLAAARGARVAWQTRTDASTVEGGAAQSERRSE